MYQIFRKGLFKLFVSAALGTSQGGWGSKIHFLDDFSLTCLTAQASWHLSPRSICHASGLLHMFVFPWVQSPKVALLSWYLASKRKKKEAARPIKRHRVTSIIVY